VNIPTHPLEYGRDQLQSLIARRVARGRSVHSETLWLYKRSTLPLSVPLLALVGLPMGVRFRRPWVPCLGVVLLLWASQRAGDHLAASLGAGLAASLPLGVLFGVVIAVWIGWRDR
jgi:lipopolysaccharide export LptBFGC system permease protein LptF